jgi:hypothetical protein
MMKIKIKNSIENKTIQMVIGLLENSPLEIEKCTLGIDPMKLQTRPDPDSWSAVEILAHLHACATIWGNSIEKMLQENNPIIADLHPRNWDMLKDFSALSFDESFKIYKHNRQNLISKLLTLSLEEWGNSGWIKHKKHTVFSQARRMALHEFDHLDQFEKNRNRLISGIID